MSKYTPGPWTFSRWDEFGDARFYVSQAEGAPYTPDYSDVATLIAETVSSERTIIQEANAHLIAAAPELLDALRRAESVIRSLDYPVDVSITSAIAKAEGAAK